MTGKALAVGGADISDSEQAAGLVDLARKETGKLDILVNNAGITRDGLFMRMSDEDWDLVLNVNLRGAALCARSAAKVMFKQRSGKIINISSVIGLTGNAGQANYAASKGGIQGFTRCIATELARRKITVNAVAPGFVMTDMTEAVRSAAEAEIKKKIASRRLGEPQDIANAVLFLASDEASYITGQVLCVDGGLTLGGM